MVPSTDSSASISSDPLFLAAVGVGRRGADENSVEFCRRQVASGVGAVDLDVNEVSLTGGAVTQSLSITLSGPSAGQSDLGPDRVPSGVEVSLHAGVAVPDYD